MKNVIKLTGLICALALPGIASAIPVYNTFGPLTGANFGGSGIPNGSVAVSKQFYDGNNLITVAMNATERYDNPVVTNNGLGTFYAGTGSNIKGPGAGTMGALWNWNYYIKVEGVGPSPPSPILTDYDIDLYFDFNPAFDNLGASTLGKINVTAALKCYGSVTSITQGSENLMFGYLAAATTCPVPGPNFGTALLTPSLSFPTFNPNVTGEYNFSIRVARDGWGVENVAMDVQVVPVPAAVWLFGSALGLLGVARRQRAAS
jgi:hypothetical protein